MVEFFAVLGRDGRTFQPYGFHHSEREALAAMARWQKRHPHRKWRVAHLKEA